MRVGLGYDVHKLTEGRDLILGGVNIPYEKGLLGHSDADVLVHAIMVLKQLIQKGRDRTLTLRSCDSDNLIPETLEKHLCLRQYTAPVFFRRPLQDNARTFKYNIVVIHTFLVIRAGMPHRTVFRPGGRSL